MSANGTLPEGVPVQDSMSEIRAMVLLSQPCPPLPIMCTKELGGGSGMTDGEYHRGNSHDLLANMMNVRTVQSDDEHNKRRLEVQLRSHASLMAKMDAWADNDNSGKTVVPPDETIYEFYCAYFREYLQSYVDNGTDTQKESDVRVYGIDTVRGDNDPVLVAARDFAKAQNKLYGEVPTWLCGGGGNIDTMTYREILRLCAARIMSSSDVD